MKEMGLQHYCILSFLTKRNLHSELNVSFFPFSLLFARWPKLLLRYTREKAHDWRREFGTYIVVGRAVRGLVSQLSPRFYKMEEIPDDGFADVVSLMEEHDAAEVIINELNEIIHDNERYSWAYYFHQVEHLYLHLSIMQCVCNV